MIRSNAHAFEILEKSQHGIPYEAIRYLYYQPAGDDIRDKVIYWLENAYNEKVLNEQKNHAPNAPLWYAILAENYITEDLLDPVMNLFSTTEEDWDLLNEQGVVLLNLLCKKLGDTAITAFFNKILEQIKVDSKFPYLYLFESFKFINPDKYSDKILALLDTKSHWLVELLGHFPWMQFSQKKHSELLAKIYEKLELIRLEYEMMETLDHIDRKILRGIIICQDSLSKFDYPKVKIKHHEREDWEAYLRSQENLFEQPEEPTKTPPSSIKRPAKKIGRNAPCPCGSEKKYKHCCLKI